MSTNGVILGYSIYVSRGTNCGRTLDEVRVDRWEKYMILYDFGERYMTGPENREMNHM